MNRTISAFSIQNQGMVEAGAVEFKSPWVKAGLEAGWGWPGRAYRALECYKVYPGPMRPRMPAVPNSRRLKTVHND